jgi:hypothetical protein
MVAECVVYSDKAVLYERWNGYNVLSYDIFKVEANLMDDDGWLDYPDLRCFISPFHNAKRVYVRGERLSREDAKILALNIFFDYIKDKLPF